MGRVGEYEILETLGEGAYSKVKKVVHIPSGSMFVAKIIPKTNCSVENDVRLEISILRRLNHRNIVQLIEVLESTNNYYIILEPVMGGDLCDLITNAPGPLPEQDVAALFIQLVAGVRACHRNGVAHRDLKPENLLLSTNYVLKISDFGLSRLHRQSHYEALSSEYAHTLTGTLVYVAPEVFGRTYDAFKADLWSMGCILYVLLTQNFPFGSANDPTALEQRIRKGQVSEMPCSVSTEAQHLCRWLLSQNPEDRPNLDTVARHAFFVKNLPPNYMTIADGRRHLVVEGANVDEFSSKVQDEGNNATVPTGTLESIDTLSTVASCSVPRLECYLAQLLECDKLFNKLSEKDAAFLFIQIIAGVWACQHNGTRERKGLGHCDVSPGCTEEGNAFCLSCSHGPNSSSSDQTVGKRISLAFAAPEVYGEVYDSFKADLWSMGCILYVLLTQSFPFGSASDPTALAQRLCKEQISEMPCSVSTEAQHLCRWLLSQNPEDRPNLDTVARHAFFVKNLPPNYMAIADGSRHLVVDSSILESFFAKLQYEVNTVGPKQ